MQAAYRFSSGKMKERIGAKQLAQVLDLTDRLYDETLRLTGVQRAHLTLGTLRKFCQGSDTKPTISHVPQHGRLLGVPKEIVSTVKAETLIAARQLWSRMIDRKDRIPLGHDGYLKLWALDRPKLDADFILLDEAQDTNQVVLGVLNDQAAQIVYVGDRHQQIYEWRGAINAMDEMPSAEDAWLTQSFRFGPVIAQAASLVLRALGEKKTLLGTQSINSVIVDQNAGGTVLARTNAAVISEVLGALENGRKPYVIGGVEELKRLVSDVFELKAGRGGTTPEFFGFENWGQVLTFAETEEGEELRMFVRLVEQYGERRLWAGLAQAHHEERTADMIVSTAHKAKGREWHSVRLAPDFLSSSLKEGEAIPDAEIRLFYVAMTRAKRVLAVDHSLLDAFTSGSKKGQQHQARDTSTVRPAQIDMRTTPREAAEAHQQRTRAKPKVQAPRVELPARASVTSVNGPNGKGRPAAASSQKLHAPAEPGSKRSGAEPKMRQVVRQDKCGRTMVVRSRRPQAQGALLLHCGKGRRPYGCGSPGCSAADQIGRDREVR